MTRISILYPSKAGSRFDVDYYVNVHMPMAARLLGSAIKSVSIDIGVGGSIPGQPAPFAAIAGFVCDSPQAFTAAFMPVADQLQGDIPKYTDIEPVIQISELREI
jgi:uncharacterized protein (TIGR02118 family)